MDIPLDTSVRRHIRRHIAKISRFMPFSAAAPFTLFLMVFGVCHIIVTEWRHLVVGLVRPA